MCEDRNGSRGAERAWRSSVNAASIAASAALWITRIGLPSLGMLYLTPGVHSSPHSWAFPLHPSTGGVALR